MSETIRVPLEGQHVTPQAQAPQPQEQPRPETGFVNNQYVPPSERVTLHKTRLGAAMAKRTEQAAPAPTAPQPSQTDALSQQINQLTNTVTLLAANQLGNMQRGHDAPEPWVEQLGKLQQHHRYNSGTPYTEDGGSQSQWGGPNPLDYDFYDDLDTSNFHRRNDDYINQTVQQRLEATAAAQQEAAQAQDRLRQGAALQARFGRDRNFDEAVQEMAKLVIDSGYKLPLEEAYLQASAELEQRNGQKRSAFLPKDITTLGGIERYRRETGRIK